ncbi:hypothetical protein LTR66_002310 [Elasticomyces elasticus]|nr:hypothetical protein LTR66_002310 [Elasticomyces elasticus]
MKTRTNKKPATKIEGTEAATVATAKPLDPSDANPPNLLILPRDVSPDARVMTMASPATGVLTRYLLCPDKGIYEFTRVSPANKTPRSWLLVPERAVQHQSSGKVDQPYETPSQSTSSAQQSYVKEDADLLVATPIDPLFLLLPALSPPTQDTNRRLFLSLEDRLDVLVSTSPYLRSFLQLQKWQQILERRMEVTCDTVEAADEKMYRLSLVKLMKELVTKARNMVAKGLPRSMEKKFVREALNVPIMNIKREDSSFNVESGDGVIEDRSSEPAEITDASSTPATEDSQTSSALATSQRTDATSVSSAKESTPEANPAVVAPNGIPHLLRLHTALNFILSSYIPPHLRTLILANLSSPSSPIDFAPLHAHLSHLTTLRSQAQALRSISDNISRKRNALDDEELADGRADKKRKKEEEELKKKNESRGVKQLKKVDVSGMKKMSAFFAKAPAKKK